ncbi:ras-domain-containing protein [Gloeophyllum trabeum ATCC 11539]|uniref:Ras-domain-containing protein n=1 Tax=Gloeophyllum trabeum (strain ATCC 11539 / FP-39264 / Madison 617) TaxID=670483 RepID=S7QP66_GLOTA|nr:ras-domain-containing protein [Gloeophyllum trabeum ATCC 11539]EPQ61366.1 ras-domain-containing protein [Gloeophyllum trabeum ATCC 11539]
MRTVKVVVIGASGVGKTSLRGQYISGRFSTGYRATIGADFISKTLPHYAHPDENVTLQIWDTAGQERFSSLSSAFFRGADAAILVFDVNHPQTLDALRKWWDEFKEKAPLRDDEVDEFCCVVVGNKVDLVGGEPEAQGKVSELDALRFMDEIIPPSEPDSDDTLQSHPLEFPHSIGDGSVKGTGPTNSIEITDHRRRHSHSPTHLLSKSRSRSRSSKFLAGTVTTTHTTLSIYHTPSSSLFDAYESARSSPAPSSSPAESVSSSLRSRKLSNLSMSTTSSAPTITPSLFAHQQHQQHRPPPPERKPKLFFTSAKTGEGVPDVFEYIARRVVRRWEYEEAVESRVMHMQEPSESTTVRLDEGRPRKGLSGKSCCSS